MVAHIRSIHSASVACSVEAVLGNRELLQQIVRLSLGGDFDPGIAVPLQFDEHDPAWGHLMLVNHLWKVPPGTAGLFMFACRTISFVAQLQGGTPAWERWQGSSACTACH